LAASSVDQGVNLEESNTLKDKKFTLQLAAQLKLTRKALYLIKAISVLQMG